MLSESIIILRPGSLVALRRTRISGENIYIYIFGPGSSVGIATDYDMDGIESNPSAEEIFHPSRLVLGHTQPPVKWVLGFYWGYFKNCCLNNRTNGHLTQCLYNSVVCTSTPICHNIVL